MEKKIIGIFIVMLLIVSVSSKLAISTKNNSGEKIIIDYSRYGNYTITENGMLKTEDGWIYYPPYPNYVPSGMPDFDQRQDNWKISGNYDCCGELAMCNILWYVDSKYSDPNGIPGDGIDIFPLVSDYNAPSDPNPGPLSDDHNINNVDDKKTSWGHSDNIEDYELVERFIFTAHGTGAAIQWLQRTGLSIDFVYEDPGSRGMDFYELYQLFLSGEYYIAIQLKGLDENNYYWMRHWVTLVGINFDELKIAISDPSRDYDNPSQSSPRSIHNNASIVSHDVYDIFPESVLPLYGSWGIDYDEGLNTNSDFIVSRYAWLRENTPPLIPIISGPKIGNITIEYYFNINSSDKHEDDILYYIDWGDGVNNNWSEQIDSGEIYNTLHIWNETGNYIIKAKVKDEHGAESDWATFEVSMPKSKQHKYTPILDFLKDHPHLFPLLQKLLIFPGGI